MEQNNNSIKKGNESLDASLLGLHLGFIKNDVSSAMTSIERAKEYGMSSFPDLKTSLETAYDDLCDIYEEIEEQEEKLEVKAQ